jgi:hypothetical protein
VCVPDDQSNAPSRSDAWADEYVDLTAWAHEGQKIGHEVGGAAVGSVLENEVVGGIVGMHGSTVGEVVGAYTGAAAAWAWNLAVDLAKFADEHGPHTQTVDDPFGGTLPPGGLPDEAPDGGVSDHPEH